MGTMTRACVALLLLQAAIRSAEAQSGEIETCTVTDFKNGKILYTWEAMASDGNLLDEGPVIRVADGNNNYYSPLYQLQANSGIGSNLNYNSVCNNGYKLCEAHIGILDQPEIRQYLFGSNDDLLRLGPNDKRLQIKTQNGANWINCIAVGRDLNFVNDTLYDFVPPIDVFEISYGNVPTERLGTSAIPTAIVAFTEDGANTTGIKVVMSNGDEQLFGRTVGTNTSTSLFDLSGNPSVAVITIYYNDPLTDAFDLTSFTCGLMIEFEQDLATFSQGCSNANQLIFHINDGYEFAGFIGWVLPDTDATLFLLQPLEYKKFDSMIYYYGRTDTDVSIYINRFESVPLNYSYTWWSDTTTSGGHQESSDSGYKTTATGKTQVDITEPTCGCVRVEFDLTAGGDDSIYAWTFGFIEDDDDKTTADDLAINFSENFQTASQFESRSNENTCPDIRPMKYIPSLQGGALYLDGMLGRGSGISTPIDASDIVNFNSVFNRVNVYYDDINVIGLQLTWNNVGTVNIGSTGASSPNETLSATSLDHILTRLEIITRTGNLRSEVIAHFAQPTPPCMFTGAYVDDIAGSWQQGDSNYAVRTHDHDADQYEYWFHMPVSFTELHVELSGYFLSQECSQGCTPEVYSVYLDSEGAGFGKGEVGTGKFYHLQAEHSYTFTMTGEVDDYADTGVDDLNSTESTQQQFMTPDGVRYYCRDNNGENTYVQVEYEALPDIEIKFAETENLAVLNSSATLVAFSSIGAQTDQFPDDEFFHFRDNEHKYPKFPEFAGYPIKVLLYWTVQNTTANIFTDDCIRGMALVYKDRDGNTGNFGEFTKWLAGTEQGFIDSNNAVTVTLNGPVDIINGNYDEEDGASCLSAIQFEYAISGETACYGPESCENQSGTDIEIFTPEGFLRNEDEFYWYGFSGSSDDGEFIVRLMAYYAYVDLPTVQSGPHCVLDDMVDWFYIRNTMWYREINIAARGPGSEYEECGITQYVYAASTQETTAVPYQRDPDRNNNLHEVVYHQAIIRTRDNASSITERDDNSGVTVTRENDWEVNLFCYYNASDIVRESFAVEGEEGYEAYGTQQFNFSLVLYHECDYINPYSSDITPILLLNEPVYMAIHLDDPLNDQNQYSVRGFSCWANKASHDDATKRTNYYLLSGYTGCYADSTFRWNTSATRQLKEAFYFDAFAWTSQSRAIDITPIEITCQVRACLETETGSNGLCDKEFNTGCTGPPFAYDPFVVDDGLFGKRSKRNAIGGGQGGGSSAERVITSTNTFIVKRRAVDMNSNMLPHATAAVGSVHFLGGQDGVRMTSALFSMFVTTMFFCLLVVSYRAYKLRNNYQRLRDQGSIDGGQ